MAQKCSESDFIVLKGVFRAHDIPTSMEEVMEKVARKYTKINNGDGLTTRAGSRNMVNKFIYIIIFFTDSL